MSFIIGGIGSFLFNAFTSVDKKVKDTPPWHLIAYTTVFVSISIFLINRKLQRTSWNLKERFKGFVRKYGPIDEKVTTEMQKLKKSLRSEFAKTSKKEEIITTFPKKGMKKEEILKRLENASGTIRSGKNTGACYNFDEELDDLILTTYKYSLMTNGLHIKLNPLIRQLEAEIVRMTIHLFHGGEESVGDVTSGGTDSIAHAVLTARRRAVSLGIGSQWEIVAPETVHPAFDKAAEVFGIKLIRVKLKPSHDSNAYEVDLEAMEKAINSQTILIVASCPGFPYGIVDPIEDISSMLERKDPNKRIGLHVDCCLGGFIAPWLEKTEFKDNLKTKFGFDVPRVTTISADTHKYGNGAKGTSVLMHKSWEWRKHQIFVQTKWCGGVYATPRLPGSFPGKEIVALWATLVYHGEEGFIAKTEKIIKTTAAITKGIKEECFLKQHLEVMGDPKLMVVAFCAKNPKKLNIYDLHTEMTKRGWYLSALQNPPAIHICVTGIHAENPKFVSQFLLDLEESLNVALEYPQTSRGKSGEGPMYCSNQKFGESLFLEDFVKEYYNIVNESGPFKIENEDN